MKLLNYSYKPNNKKGLLSLFIIVLVISSSIAQSKKDEFYSGIYGNIKLDSTWSSNIYLSHIPALKDMFTMSNDMIIDETEIDSLGNFKFDVQFYPKVNNLYRLHVTKKNYPKASLIIGGQEENHFFLLVNKASNIKIEKRNPKTPFNKAIVKKSELNISLREIDKVSFFIDSLNYNSSKAKREFLTKNLIDSLKQYSLHSNHSLVSLYAFNKMFIHSKENITNAFIVKVLNKWDSETSEYFNSYRKELTNVNKSSTKNLLYVLLPLVVLMFAIIYYVRFKRKRKKISLSLLSIQEQKIFFLIVEGKSNKEISNELNIEISTVKSHLHKIYSKLNIKSRKEARNIIINN